jgi:hypothetical protein
MRVRARAGRWVDGADSSVLRGVSGRNCAKDAGAELSAAAPATMMTAAIRLTLNRLLMCPTLAHRDAAVNARASLMRGTVALLGRLCTLA